MRKHTSILKWLESPGQKTMRATCGKRVSCEEIDTIAIPGRDHCIDCAHVHAHNFDALRDLLIDDPLTPDNDRDKIRTLFVEVGIPIPTQEV